MKQFQIVLFAIMLILGTAAFADDYYTHSVNKPDAETTLTPQTPAYVMPSAPLTATISSASALLLSSAVGSTSPAFCIVQASDNVYLNGSLATPSAGILILKDTATLVPMGAGVTIVTSSDSVNLKILPVK